VRRSLLAVSAVLVAGALVVACPRAGGKAVPAPHELQWPDAAPALEQPIPPETPLDAGAPGDDAS